MNIFGRIVFLILLISSILLPSIFVASKIRDDFYVALSTMPPIFGYVAVLPIYLHKLVNRERIYSLLGELQDIVNESM